MLRAIILAVVAFVALGTIIPVATEQTEASASQEIRQYMKKDTAEKFRYRSRFRLASYSKSDRYKRTAKLRKAKRNNAGKSVRPVSRKVRSTRRTIRTRKAKRTIARKRSVKRYRKVRRSSAKRRAIKRSSKRYTAKKRTVRRTKVRKYSQRWWRNYRARQQKQNEIARIKSAMRTQREALIAQRQAAENLNFVEQASQIQTGGQGVATQLIMNSDGTVSMVVVGPATGATIDTGRQRTLGGVSTTALRRTVIDEMIRENGWVENDYHKVVDGQKVYVVVAKAPDKRNNIQAKTYYFAESAGRIYRVSASAPKDEPEEAAERSEKMVRSLQAESKPQQAELKRPPANAVAANAVTQ
jgi:hypothetical protein